MRKRIVSAALSCFIALLAEGAVSLATSGSDRWEAGNVDLQDVISHAEWVLPARATPEAAKRQRGVRVRYYSLSDCVCHTSYLAISHGIPAKIGQDLITFIRLRTT